MPVPTSARSHDAEDPTSTVGFSDGLFKIDADGIPYYVFGPAWPISPPDVVIAPFSEFVSNGINFSYNEEHEVDSNGIPTTLLPLAESHRTGIEPKTSVKAKKKRKAAALLPADRVEERNWEDIWNENECPTLRSYDVCLSKRKRLAYALDDFQQGQFWTPNLQSIYDLLRQFLGLNNNPNQFLDRACDEGDDSTQVAAGEWDLLGDGELFVREAMMDRFIDNPERCTKIFLSSYSSHSGLIWYNSKLADAPRLVRFFIRFLLKHNVFPDRYSSLEQALLVADCALVELPACWDVSQAMTRERFGQQCLDALGSVDKFHAALDGFGYRSIPEESLAEVLDGRQVIQIFAEASCRRLEGIVEPTASSAGLAAKFATLTLVPWRGQCSLDLPSPRVILGNNRSPAPSQQIR
ncbi:hypothetical protein BKA62DRAFT_709579, partial [Auriculariales sp. MPI-PUGE-AT-0066]